VLAQMKRLPIWMDIFTYIAPSCEADVHNAFLVVAEQVREQCLSRDKLDRGILLSQAWHTFASALYDPIQRSKEDSLQSSVRDSLVTYRARCSLHSIPENTLDEIARNLLELDALKQIKAKACATAGAAFKSVRQYQLAADAFGEAAKFSSATLDFFESLCMRSNHLLHRRVWAQSALRVASGRRLYEHAQAANCWLIVARQTHCSGRIGERALLQGAEQLQQAGQSYDAAVCAARAGRPRRALDYLTASRARTAETLKEGGVHAKAMVLLCAALVGELGGAYAPI